MFGYITPEKPELKIREYDVYKAYYCGVCKSIGKRHGHIKRMTLTYDAAFMALLLGSVLNINTSLTKQRCFVHPTKKFFVTKNEIIDYASDINIILAYLNLKDKWNDDKSVLAASAMLTLRKVYKKLTTVYPDKCAIINQRINELSILEKNKCDSIDMACEPFAKLMESVLDYDAVDDEARQVLRWMGYNIGKWIYLIDAFDDLEEDFKSGSYNPILMQYKFDGKDILQFKKTIEKDIEFILLYCLSEASKAFELLGCKENKEILENILYMGMLRKTEKIMCKRSCGKDEKSI